MSETYSSLRHVTKAGIACAFLFATNGLVEETPLKPYGVDDYLKLESVGKGQGQGGRLIWEQAPPYDEIGYYGYGVDGAWGQSGFGLRTIDLNDKLAKPRALFPPESGVSYWLESVSPNGRYVVFTQAEDGVFSLGVYDLEKRRIKRFEVTPQTDYYKGADTLWVSPEEFVFSVRDDDSQPLAAARPYTGRRLAEEWEKAWNGGLSVSTDKTGFQPGEGPSWEKGRLYKANARTGGLEILAEGRFDNLRISHDGRYLAGLRQGSRVSAKNTEETAAASQLTVFDLRDETVYRTLSIGLVVGDDSLQWSPDSYSLALYAWDNGETRQSGLFYRFDAKTGTLTAYPHKGLDLASERERGLYQRPERAVWLGDKLAVYARAYEGSEPRFTYRDVMILGSAGELPKADWFLLDTQGRSRNLTAGLQKTSPIPLDADGKSMAILADGDVWRVSPGTPPRKITEDLEQRLELPNSVQFTTERKRFDGYATLISRDKANAGFALLGLRKEHVSFVASPTQDSEFIAGSVSAGSVLFRSDTDDGAKLVLGREGEANIVVDVLNAHMSDVAKTKWSTIRYRVLSQAGESEVESCVLLPPDYEQGVHYPVIVEIYPIRAAHCANPAWRKYKGIGREPGAYSEHLLAARGYIVFQPNTSAALTQTSDGPLGGMASMVEQGVRALVQQGYADGEQVGLLGFSQGGFSSLWLASQSSLFDATVSVNGWSDMYTHYFDSTYLDSFYSGEGGFAGAAGRYAPAVGAAFPLGVKPYEDPLAYVSQSPLLNAPKVSDPVLLIHSDMDGFALHQYERMFVALKQNGKTAKLLRYWGEGHGPSSPDNIRHMWRETFDWFDCYVKRDQSICAYIVPE